MPHPPLLGGSRKVVPNCQPVRSSPGSSALHPPCAQPCGQGAGRACSDATAIFLVNNQHTPCWQQAGHRPQDRGSGIVSEGLAQAVCASVIGHTRGVMLRPLGATLWGARGRWL